MPARLCQELVGMARGWQGWLALRQKNYSEAVRNFDAAPAPAWSAWAAGRRAFDQRNYSQAADFYQKAVSAWLPPRTRSGVIGSFVSQH